MGVEQNILYGDIGEHGRELKAPLRLGEHEQAVIKIILTRSQPTSAEEVLAIINEGKDSAAQLNLFTVIHALKQLRRLQILNTKKVYSHGKPISLYWPVEDLRHLQLD